MEEMISDDESTRAQQLIWVPPLTTAGRAEEWAVSSFLFHFFYNFTYFWLGWVFVAVGGYSLVAVHGLLTAAVSFVGHRLSGM